MGTASQRSDMIIPDIIQEGNVLQFGHQQFLTKPFTKEDVLNALRGIDSNKAPDIDGYSAGFFKAAWHIVEENVTQAVLDFFAKSS